ncbi:MAG: AAA family ATPase, partial [Geminicoccaceae bacterium]
MIIVLVANTKGGCGKTTVSTHLAAAFAGAGQRTALADADRQRSSLEWTRLRPGTAPPIAGLDWSKDVAQPPKGLDRLVIDAPAAMRKKDVFE